LHTDGAHLADPPDFVVLFAEEPNETPTRLFRPTMMSRQHMPPSEELRHGMFVVRNGRDSFFASAYDLRRYRFDRGCMTPCDARAHVVDEFFATAEERALAHDWTAPHQILIIDNRRTLHAREAVAAGDDDRTLVRVAYRIGGAR
jgi:alpha-ketoglutarate-dependent taurine dioxygenase